MKRYYKKMTKLKSKPIAVILSSIILLVIGILTFYQNDSIKFANTSFNSQSYKIENIPEYSGQSYVVINNNQPNFTEKDHSITEELYSELDLLGRCGIALAKVGINTMPTEKRSSIGMIKPSGWHTVKYDSINGKYLYNRCHLIGYQLTGENANPKNLITCTRYMNASGMLEFENKVAEYVKETNNHVLYRVTPIFKGNNLLASGVEIEAKSIEDNGKGISFNVYVYNIQEGIEIDYSNGNSRLIKKDIPN